MATCGPCLGPLALAVTLCNTTSNCIAIASQLHRSFSVIEHEREPLLGYPAASRIAQVGSWTPLVIACYRGHRDAVALLLEGGCPPNTPNVRAPRTTDPPSPSPLSPPRSPI